LLPFFSLFFLFASPLIYVWLYSELREEIQEIATQAEQSLKQALKDVDRQIDEVNIRLTGYRAQLEGMLLHRERDST
jgi:hypothetical protein